MHSFFMFRHYSCALQKCPSHWSKPTTTPTLTENQRTQHFLKNPLTLREEGRGGGLCVCWWKMDSITPLQCRKI